MDFKNDEIQFKANFKLNPINIEEYLISINDFDVLSTFMKYMLCTIKNGTRNKFNFSLDTILKNISIDNIDKACHVLNLALQIQENDKSLIDLMQKLSLENKWSLINLKLLNTVIQPNCTNEMLTEHHLGIEFILHLLNVSEDSKTNYNYIITHIIPKYLKICGENAIFEIIWKKSCETKNLALISGLAPLILNSSTFTILNFDSYWQLLQEYFASNDGTKYKIAMYLLKISCDILKNLDNFTTNNKIISFNKSSKKICFKSLDYLSILMDVSREKQLHLIQPSIPMLYKINNLHESWQILIYKILLKHPHNSVVYYVLIMLFKTNSNLINCSCLINNVLLALNKAESSKLTKQMFKELNNYILNLDDDLYKNFMTESLQIRWNPVAFYLFYKNVITPENCIEIEILNKIICKAKQLPHRYIRLGCLHLIHLKIHKMLAKNKMDMQILVELILELLSDENSKLYAIRLIKSNNVIINEQMLNEMKTWLEQEFPNCFKIDLIVEIINRRRINFPYINTIYQHFKQRKYKYAVLDRLTYLYIVKLQDLQDYLLHRLDINEEMNAICHIDKPQANIIDKSVKILISDSCESQQSLAFEILYYSLKTGFQNVYQFWLNKILKNEKLATNLATGFVNLLSKLPPNYVNSVIKFEQILHIYEEFFSTQSNQVAVKIFRNLDFIFERIDLKNKSFIKLSLNKLNQLKGSDCYENATRNFIRSLAITFDKIDNDVLDYTLQKLYDSPSEVIAYYNMMYFKYKNISPDVFPKYEYLLFGEIFTKTERAEYEICTEIYLSLHNNNPCFRPAEIRKWALEDVLFDVTEENVIRITTKLIAIYKQDFNKRYFPDSKLHLQKLRIMQTFAFITPYLTGKCKDDVLELLTASFCCESHQASVRQLMQYILMQLLKNDSTCLQLLSKVIDDSSKTQTSTITGFLPVLYGLELMNNDIEFSMNVIEIMLPWTMGAHFKLRLYSQLVINKICTRNLTNRKFKLKYEALHKAIETVLNLTKVIESSITNDMELVQFIFREKPHSDYKKLIYLISIYIPEKCNVSVTEWECYKIKNAWSKYAKENQAEICDELNLNLNIANVQKKIVPWQKMLQETQMHANLILVTTLIESVANLGGLSRTCEIFGVKQMVVNNAKVINDKEFQSLSMSSERWLDIIEVKTNDLNDFILHTKQLGFKIVGAEQTSDSIALNLFKFEEKTLLLLGNERSGIPANLIPFLDDCVEIPQFGMVRSLNVHVAGAMFIWEYAKQHLIK